MNDSQTRAAGRSSCEPPQLRAATAASRHRRHQRAGAPDLELTSRCPELAGHNKLWPATATGAPACPGPEAQRSAGAASWNTRMRAEAAWTRVEARGQPAATTLNEQRSQQLRDAARGSGHEPRAEAVDWPDAVIASQMSRGAGRGAAASRGTRAAPKSWSSQSELNSRCAELASHKRRWSATATEAGARASGQRRSGSRPTVGLGAQRSCVATAG